MNFGWPQKEENLQPEVNTETPSSQQEENLHPQEVVESRELKPNDLITSDDSVDLETTKEILEKNRISYELTRRTNEQKINKDSSVPGEFIITIFDPERKNEAASFDYVKKVFTLLKDSGVIVRYGNNPEVKNEALDEETAAEV
jgi:hypothetical protein